MEARNRAGIGFVVPARLATQPGGIGSLESILGLLKSLKSRAQVLLLPNFFSFFHTHQTQRMDQIFLRSLSETMETIFEQRSF
jgi:hypothetical protein